MTPRAARVALVAVMAAACARPPVEQRGEFAAVADSVVAQFTRTPLVALGERHRSRQIHRFIHELLAHPDFPNHVDDIVVEFGSAYYQSIADRYVMGSQVSRAELEHLWRGTGQWLVWDSPLYEQFYAAVRARNGTLPENDRIRVLLGDPPIHWPAVHTAEEYRRFAERDAHFAEVVEREVLARGRRALLIMGSTHFQRRGPTDAGISSTRPGVGEILGRRHADALFVIQPLGPSPERAAEFGLVPAPTFRRARGSPLERQSFARMVPRNVRVRRVVGADTAWIPLSELAWPPIAEVVDAVMYLGPDSTTVDPDASIYRDSVYQAELRRRAVILEEVYGFPFLPDLEALLQPPTPR
jgi:hypothetical protein